MKKTTLGLLLAAILGICTPIFGQDSTLSISGSVDFYYKYDFKGNDGANGVASNFTSFAEQHNSISLGMIDVLLTKTWKKATFVGEVSFGPRSVGSIGEYVGIQNLYVAYALTDKLTATAGYMGTFLGYEVISPLGNFHYTVSNMFTNGPFQNAGIKFNYAFTEKVSLMAGLFQRWNQFDGDDFGLSDFGAQLYISPVEGWDAYLNFITGPAETEIDLTTKYQVSEKFLLGLNAAIFNADGSTETVYGAVPDFSAAALYASYDITDNFALGARYELFKQQENDLVKPFEDNTISALTISSNIKLGPVTLIPELRFDNSEAAIFPDKEEGKSTKNAGQALIAVVYGF